MNRKSVYPLVLQRKASCITCGQMFDAAGRAGSSVCKSCLDVVLSPKAGETVKVASSQGHYWTVKAFRKHA